MIDYSRPMARHRPTPTHCWCSRCGIRQAVRPTEDGPRCARCSTAADLHACSTPAAVHYVGRKVQQFLQVHRKPFPAGKNRGERRPKGWSLTPDLVRLR